MIKYFPTLPEDSCSSNASKDGLQEISSIWLFTVSLLTGNSIFDWLVADQSESR